MSFPLTNIAAVIVFIFLVVGTVVRFLRQRELRILAFRNRCGLESERSVLQQVSSGKADAKLADRTTCVDVSTQERSVAEWQTAPSRFVDFPEVAVTEANDAIEAFRGSHGYLDDSVEQHAADISVTYRRVMEDYRTEPDVTVWQPRQDASRAEDLRAIMIQYRAVFDEPVPGGGEFNVRSRGSVSDCSGLSRG